MSKVILVAEDELALRKVLCDKFMRAGYTCIEAADGEEALKEALSKKPDLLLMDVNMPKLNGMDMLKKLRMDDWGKTVPVIVLTNLSGDEQAQLEAVNATHPAYFLVKAEVEIAEVFEKVEELLV